MINIMVYLLLGMLSISAYGYAQSETLDSDVIQAVTDELSNLSLEELMNIQITSVSKKSQTVSDAPAAVFVITQDDIRRFGVTSIPDALRMVPGIQVAQIDANKWAVSSRGFLGRFSNKLLVMIDGRTVYTTLFSGTFWENQDLMLEDIDRIEVIRGPGAALWGSNAVNGVINIITKHAKDTQGGLFSMRSGTEETALANFRYGGTLGEDTFYRWYIKNRTVDDLVLRDGSDAMDEWQQMKTGFRMDSQVTETDTLMLQSNLMHGDTYSNGIIFSPNPPYNFIFPFDNETNIFDFSSRWEREINEDESLALQMFYTWDDRQLFDVKEERHTVDLDFQHRFPILVRHEILWGAGYRFTTDQITNSEKVMFFDKSRDLHLFSLFVQDEISLIEDELSLYLGTKLEHNDFTGVEIQPNARLIWTLNEQHTLWAAVSRAVRTPSRADERALNNFFVVPPNTAANPFPLPAVARGISGTRIESEDLLAFEVGYRSALFDRAALDIAVFYHLYDQLVNGQFGELHVDQYLGAPFLIVPFISIYNQDAESYGAEIAVDFTMTDWWSLKPAYTYYQVQFEDELEYAGVAVYKDAQYHQFSLRSQMNFPHNVEFDLWLRYIDNNVLQKTPAYLVLDGRVGWKPKENIELAAGFQNVLDDSHQEFGNPFFDAIRHSEIEHRVYASVSITF